MIFDFELLFEEMLNLLLFPRLAVSEHLHQLFLFVFVEFRGPTAPETRHQSLKSTLVQGVRPPPPVRCRPSLAVGSFRNRIAVIEVLQKPQLLFSAFTCVHEGVRRFSPLGDNIWYLFDALRSLDL